MWVSGWYPALVLSRLTPLNAIRRNVSMTGVARLSRVLVSVQLAISVGLITCTLVMYHQIEHLMTRHGFESDRIIAVNTDPLVQYSPQHPALVEAFLRHHRIASVTLVEEDLRDSHRSDYRAVTESGRGTKIRLYTVDRNFVETMNLELISGRDFSLAQRDKDNLALISESAAARLGLADPIGETIKVGRMSRSRGFRPATGARGDGARIIGVVKDFTLESGYEDIPPGLLLLNPHLGPRHYIADLMFVRVRPGDMQEVIQYMQESWSRIVAHNQGYDDFEFSFLQQDLEVAYRDEFRWRQLITWAAVGAVFISAVGCLCPHCSRRRSPH